MWIERSRRACLAAIACAALLSSCARGAGLPPVAQPTKQSLPMVLTFDIAGSVRAHAVSRRVDVQRVTMLSQSISLFSIATPAFDHEGKQLSLAFDLLPYSGDGRYVIDGWSADAELAVRSGAYVMVAEGKVARAFRRAAQDCTVEIRSEGNAGELSCPSIAEEEGPGSVSLRMTWEA